MEIVTEAMDGDITRVVMIGRLDFTGAAAIDLKLSVVAGSRKKVVFDVAQVTFMASMGIRSIVSAAKTIKAKGGRSVLLSPSADVEKVLVISGIDTMIPIVHDINAVVGVLGD